VVTSEQHLRWKVVISEQQTTQGSDFQNSKVVTSEQR
jgi:hypothetical protein